MTGGLFRFLKRCPLLEELELDYIKGVTTTIAHETVGLPHLRLYSYSTTNSVHLDLIDKLSFPQSCSVVFNYWNGSRSTNKTDQLLRFHNPSPLANLKRVKLETKGGDATVELIDARNTRVYLVTNVSPGGRDLDLGDHSVIHRSYAAHLKRLDNHTVEVLCVEGPSIGMLDHAGQVLSCLQAITTLVLSGGVVTSYLFALGQKFVDHSGGGVGLDGWRCPTLDVLVIHSRDLLDDFEQDILRHLHRIAQKRKKGRIPFKSVWLFIRSPWDEEERGPIGSCQALEQLRGCVEKLEVVTGDGVLDWNTDDYFFAGLDVRRDRYLFRGQSDDL